MGFVNGIKIPTDEVQHTRITGMIKMNRINSANKRNALNEEGWIEVKSKAKKVLTFKKQDHLLEVI